MWLVSFIYVKTVKNEIWPERVLEFSPGKKKKMLQTSTNTFFNPVNSTVNNVLEGGWKVCRSKTVINSLLFVGMYIQY